MPTPPGEEAVAAFQRQREREQAVAEMTEPVEPRSHVERLAGQSTGVRPVPAGFKNLDSFPAAGIRVNSSLDRKVVAIQFAEDRRASRDGLISEVDTLQIEGFQYKPERRQWERGDREQPGANLVDARRLGADVARARVGRE